MSKENTIEKSDLEKALDLLDKADELVKAKKNEDDKKAAAKRDEEEDDDLDGDYDKDDEEEKSMKKASHHSEKLAKAGKTKKEVEDEMVKKGFPTEMIKEHVEKSFKKHEDEEMKKSYEKKKKEVEEMEKSLVEKGMLPYQSKASDVSKAKDKKDKEDEKEEKEMHKAISDLQDSINIKFHSVGQILKSLYDEIALVKGMTTDLKTESGDIKKSLEDSTDLIKGVTDDVDDLQKALEQSAGRKSVQTDKQPGYRDRNFTGNDDLNKGVIDANAISVRDRRKMLDLLDAATFAKGFDSEFGDAMKSYESTGRIAPAILSRLQAERGIKFVS